MCLHINFGIFLDVSERVFMLDQSMSSDICVQIVKKYNKFSIHVGAFRISVSGGAPESYNSDSYVAKKGLCVLSLENIEALGQLKDVLTEEMEQLKNMWKIKESDTVLG